MVADNRGPEEVATVSLFLGLSAVTVALRCYVRACILKAFQVEDWLALATMVCFLITGVFTIMSVSHGAGKRFDDVPVENIPKVLKMRWSGEIAYTVTAILVKFTVGIFLWRICSQRWQKMVIYTTLAVCFVYGVFYTCMAALQCQPIEYYWFRYTTQMPGKCLSESLVMGATYTAAVINAIGDWVLGVLPIALVRHLQLSKRSKILLSCTLALGSIASTATIIRIPYFWQLTQTDDILHDFADLSIWSTVENGLGLVASSVATLRPLIKMVFKGSQTAPSLSHQRQSSQSWMWSWRRSEISPIHHRAHSENLHYHRMHDYGLYKMTERASVRGGLSK